MSNQKEPYFLNEMEYAVLQDALLKGMKGVIHFDKFMLNTSFIVSSYRKERKLKPEFEPKQLEEPVYNPTPEQMERTRIKIEEIKKNLHIKFSMSDPQEK
jgi:hypothetical protein